MEFVGDGGEQLAVRHAHAWEEWCWKKKNCWWHKCVRFQLDVLFLVGDVFWPFSSFWRYFQSVLTIWATLKVWMPNRLTHKSVGCCQILWAGYVQGIFISPEMLVAPKSQEMPNYTNTWNCQIGTMRQKTSKKYQTPKKSCIPQILTRKKKKGR